MPVTPVTKTKSLRYVIKPTVKTYVGIKNMLIIKLGALLGEGGGTLFSAVYGVNETQPNGYPVCYVLEKAGRGQILDTGRNEREWQFDIVIHQEIGQRTPEAAYTALLDAADRVITSLDQDPMLADSNGEARCKYARVVPLDFEFTNQEAGVHRAVLTVAVVDIVSRFA